MKCPKCEKKEYKRAEQQIQPNGRRDPKYQLSWKEELQREKIARIKELARKLNVVLAEE